MMAQSDAHHQDNNQAQCAPISVADCLAVDRVVVDLSTTSRKRLLEQLAVILCQSNPELVSDMVFKTLTSRERLGSTALGYGIAIPHGRIEGLDRPLIAVARLSNSIDYDAPDGQPVWLAVSLLVPDDACSDHLQLLSGLASLFNDMSFVATLKACKDSTQLYTLLTQKEPVAQ